MDALTEYRNKHAQKIRFIKYKEKYGKLIILNKIERSVCRIQSFIRRYILFNVVNMSDDEIKLIEPIYRYRMMYSVDKYNQYGVCLKDLQMIYESQKHDVIGLYKNTKSKTVLEHMNTQLEILEFDYFEQVREFKKTPKYIPIMINICEYNKPINIDGVEYYLDEFDCEILKKKFENLSESSTFGVRFRQMLLASKILSDAYTKVKTSVI